MPNIKFLFKPMFWIIFGILAFLIVIPIWVFIHLKQSMEADNGKPVTEKVIVSSENKNCIEGLLVLNNFKPATFRTYLIVYPKRFHFPPANGSYVVRDSLVSIVDSLFQNSKIRANIKLETLKGQTYIDSSFVCCCTNFGDFFMKIANFNIPNDIPFSPEIKLTYQLKGNLKMISDNIDSMKITVGVYGSWK